MPNFYWFTDTQDDGPYIAYQPVREDLINVRRPHNRTQSDPDLIELKGTYIVEAFDQDGYKLDVEAINILKDLVVTCTPGLATVNFTGFYNEATAPYTVSFRPTQAERGLTTVHGFGEVPDDIYACISYKAPIYPGTLIRFSFDVTYNSEPDLVSYFNVFVMTDYCHLNQKFINGVLHKSTVINC